MILSKRSYCISLTLMTASAVLLLDSRALFAPYLIALLFAVFSLNRCRKMTFDKKKFSYRTLVVVSAICALLLTLANYAIWAHPILPDVRSPFFVRLVKLLTLAVLFSGIFASCLNIFRYVCFSSEAFSITKQPAEKKARFFLIPFVIILCIYLVIWLCCYYPGLMSLDSIDQVSQLFSGEYSNHQPFYHTMLLGVFMRIGLFMFKNMNAAIATYTVIQILFMAMTFSYVTYNLAVLDMPLWTVIASCAWYALMPFHIMFSFTVWKDVYFGAFTTLLIMFFIRIMKNIGKEWLNLAAFVFSSLMMCLIRSNGLFAYVFVFAAVLLLARKKRKLLFSMIAVIVVSFVLKHSVLAALNVVQPDTVESLSIPLQQVARVVADDGVMSEEDMRILSNIIDVSSIKDTYDPDISDPIKNAIRDLGNQKYLSENMGEFAGLYLRGLVHNPMKYVEAWVDSTCGYWNSGYNYWIWFWDVESNPYGISRVISSEGVLRAMDEYLWLFYNNRLLQVFGAIGLFVWITVIAFARCISDNNRTGIIAIMPIAAILLSLLVSSPVYAEFRYMYALFCALPILLAVTCHQKENENDNHM